MPFSFSTEISHLQCFLLYSIEDFRKNHKQELCFYPMNFKRAEHSMMVLKLNQLNFILVVVFSPHIIAHECSSGLFGPRCQYICHCEDVTTCNSTTGECDSGCADGWDGHVCQRQNIALKRIVKQSSTAYGGVAEKAVDGFTCTYYDERKKEYSCSHTNDNPKQAPFWMVYLDEPTTLHYMQIFNRVDNDKKYSYRLQKFYVTVANTSDIDDNVECYSHNDTKFSAHIFHCTKPVVASVVRVRLYHLEPLTICEFKIYKCSEYWFGKDCSQQCNCRNITEVCNPVTGACRSGIKIVENKPKVSPRNETPEKVAPVEPSSAVVALSVLLVLSLCVIIVLGILLIQKSNFVNRFSITRLQF
ncbi:uncharacterized protein LOC115214877 isoform X1 [Octopus sinensis]|uniref:Uncharacterized protein LOC115214877 isoform X1 n=2 Tax=Octopus sinensis TaxID=2607531 RepID=A0A7E6F1S3_9MOLL|nr:uncharacterized protein LOC115214877 isoform X1 [Octopus sinensis]